MFNTGDMGKSELTRQTISDVALASFIERGYDATTMRLIAAEAGTSVGNAYYYFPTKNHLVQELYVRVQRDHWNRAAPLLAERADLPGRLEIALLAGLDSIDPYHESAPGFLSAAISPSSAVNPLSAESADAREIVVKLFREVVEGSATVMPGYLKERLPEILWLAYLGLALYWVYDSSPAQVRSRRLTRRAVALFATTLPLARMPFMRGPITELLDLIAEARS